jgi:hypothetical protein
MLGTAGSALADSNVYEMVLNKDENLCPGIMAELNRDIVQFKEIRYASDKKFPVVKWKHMADLGSKFTEDSEYVKWQWAKFDINNDHAIDLVVRVSSDNSYGPGDLYYIFDGAYNGLRDVRTRQQFGDAFRKTGIASIHATSGHLLLNDLPPLRPDVEKEWIDGSYAITPFVVKDVTYLHIDQAVSRDDGSLYHVVTKFTRPAVAPGKGQYSEVIAFGTNPKELEDVCYFRMYVDEQQTMERSADRMTLKPYAGQ